MEERKKELTNKLEQIAYQKTNAFCYSCYKTVKQSHCPKCFSDDFMRELEGVGVEYGTNWVIIELLNDALTPVNAEENFTELLEDIYPEQTKVAWLNLNTVQVLKEQDPISWNIALNEHIDNLVEEEELISFDNENYYHTQDIQNYIQEQESA